MNIDLLGKSVVAVNVLYSEFGIRMYKIPAGLIGTVRSIRILNREEVAQVEFLYKIAQNEVYLTAKVNTRCLKLAE